MRIEKRLAPRRWLLAPSLITPSLFMVAAFMVGYFSSTSDVHGTLKDETAQAFDRIATGKWRQVFHDSGTEDWADHWQLDGKNASVTNSQQGMDFHAGPLKNDDAHHGVLWTKQSFEGDLKIEYEFTKLDERHQNVVIIYILATGSGEEMFAKDIFEWSHLRDVPSMRMYFNHMNTYHLSYAAHDNTNEDPSNDYIRMRRYMPEWKQGLRGTDIGPDHFSTGLFEANVPYEITIVKRGDEIGMHIESEGQTKVMLWNVADFPPLSEGRIGLRHMHTRSARYRDFRVSQLTD